MNDMPEQLPFLYETVEHTKLNAIGFKITTGEFADMIISLGDIRFDEAVDDCVMSYDYDVEVGEVSDEARPRLEKAIGDMIVFALNEAIKNDTLSELIKSE